jgi:hypothetical protein
MQIHGCDLTIPTRFDPEDTLAHAITAIRSVWGGAIVKIDTPSEVFVYRSQDAVDAWDSKGWNARYAKDMVYLLIDLEDPKELCVVIEDNKDPELIKVVEAITEALKP